MNKEEKIKLNEYILNDEKPIGKESSVHSNDTTRFKKAEEQQNINPVKIEDIIFYTNEFLADELGMKKIENPVVKEKSYDDEFYQNLKEKYNLDDVRDIIWMKFTTDGFLGVVACSNDINFNIPSNESDYYQKNEDGSWKFHTSGIIIHHLNKKWDESFVLIFPLSNIPNHLNRHDIENGIGNYLIEKGVPILDYYSHRY